MQGEWVVAPGVTMDRVYDFRPEQTAIDRFKNERDVLYVWGKIRYRDGFRWRKRWTKFCHRYGLGRDVVIPLEIMEDSREEIPADRMRYHQYGNGTDDA